MNIIKKHTLLLLALAFIICYRGEAQIFINYTNQNSPLQNNNVRIVSIDKQGNIWFATDKELLKYNGNNWTESTTLYVLSLDVTTEEHWFGSIKGLFKHNGKNWKRNKLGLMYLLAIAIDKQNNRWFGYCKGLIKFDNEKGTEYEGTGCYVNSIAIDAQDNKWCAVWCKGVTKFDNVNYTNYTKANGFISDFVETIVVDKQNNVWFGTYEGVSKFDGNNWTNYTTANGLADNKVHTIAFDAYNNAWFGTDNGISRYNGYDWTTYTKADGLINDTVRSIAIDSENNLWIGTKGGISNLILNRNDDKNNEPDILITPNPVHNILIIKNIKPNSFLQIYDNSGKPIITQKLYSESTIINVENLQNGIYSIKIGDNKSVKKLKFIKQ